jgi:hypothetical protein
MRSAAARALHARTMIIAHSPSAEHSRTTNDGAYIAINRQQHHWGAQGESRVASATAYVLTLSHRHRTLVCRQIDRPSSFEKLIETVEKIIPKTFVID